MHVNLRDARFYTYFLISLVVLALLLDIGHTITHECNSCLPRKNPVDFIAPEKTLQTSLLHVDTLEDWCEE